MSATFETATAVRRSETSTPNSIRYAASVAPGWDIAGNANGGYLIAIAARAMADATGRPPLTVTAHFLSPGRVGECAIDVEIVRAGRTTVTATATVSSGDRPVMALLGTFGEQRPDDHVYVDGRPPVLPPFDECVRVVPPSDASGFGDRVNARVRPDDLGFAVDQPSGVPEECGWFAFDGAPPDAQHLDVFGVLQATDAFAPVCFNIPGVPLAWAPTLELTVHVRGVPAPGPLRCRFASRFVQGGMFEEDGEIYDSTDRLIAQSRQLALLPRG